MIEDLFFKRYGSGFFNTQDVHPEVARVLSQAAQIFEEEISIPLELDDEFFLSAERQLIREFGSNPFPQHSSPYNRCGMFLSHSVDLWNN